MNVLELPQPKKLHMSDTFIELSQQGGSTETLEKSSNSDCSCVNTRPLSSIELFAGAGGLALGFSAHHVEHRAVVEWNAHACATLRKNKLHKILPVSAWPDVQESDVRDFDYSVFKKIDLITGGPPCQPFSSGGKKAGVLDDRDMFPQAIRAVREVQPKAFVFENVRGLARATFKDYLAYILLQLEYPSLKSNESESWLEHLGRLKTFQDDANESEYVVSVHLVNAANYGVPQKRMRVFIVGFKRDIPFRWNFPMQTHSMESLMIDQWHTGEYWERHRVAKKHIPPKPHALMKKLPIWLDSEAGARLPWETVRDALQGLPDPEKYPDGGGVQAHRFQGGARSYPGHTGSPLDEPAKALKAGSHGVPGGENMIRKPDGSVRYFTVRESARIQTFPDEIIFDGTWGETMRQLGNAVPVRLAKAVAGSVCSALRE